MRTLLTGLLFLLLSATAQGQRQDTIFNDGTDSYMVIGTELHENGAVKKKTYRTHYKVPFSELSKEELFSRGIKLGAEGKATMMRVDSVVRYNEEGIRLERVAINQRGQPAASTVIDSTSRENFTRERNFRSALQRHLAAVENKSLEALKSTLSPTGAMELLLEGRERSLTVKEFMDFHVAWFATSGWQFTAGILDAQVGDRLGTATVEAVYREDERDGKPYFNRMYITYALELQGGKWYVIRDHAVSRVKSTD